MNGVAKKIKAYISGSVVEDDIPIDRYSKVAVADKTTYKM
jgi:hypothetical protein